MIKETVSRTTIVLAHDELMQAVLDFVKNRAPAEYDEATMTATHEYTPVAGDAAGIPCTHRLSGVNRLEVSFFTTRKEP